MRWGRAGFFDLGDDGAGDRALPGSLAILAEQLWYGVADDVRIDVGRRAEHDPAWIDVEQYWVFPTAERARLLLPATDSAAATGAVANYRYLRPTLKRHVRNALGALAHAGMPLGTTRLRIRVPADRPAAADSLPLSRMARELGMPSLRAAVGIRDRANGKATLHLLHPDGRPAGYAKVGWNATTDEYVRNETEVLRHVGAGSGPARAPAVLSAFEYAGHPVVVTAPLPDDVRTVRGAVPAPSSVEYFALTPVVRADRPARTAHLDALRRRLASLAYSRHAAAAQRQTMRLLDGVCAVEERLPVTARWHGDLTPWNCARDGEGTLWIWDWETSEPDTVAGLDALHWSFSARRLKAAAPGTIRLEEVLADAGPHLAAAGVPRRHWSTVAAVYVGTVVERACSLAAATDTTGRLWISPAELAGLVAQATEITQTDQRSDRPR